MKRWILIMIVAGVVSQASAVTRLELAEELLGLLNIEKTMQQSLDMTKKMMLQQSAQMAARSGKMDALASVQAQQTKIMDMIAAEMKWETIKPEFVSVYADIFNEEELQSLVDFYRTPAGRAFVEKQPVLMQRTMELNQKMMMRLMPRVQQMMQDLDAASPTPPASQPAE